MNCSKFLALSQQDQIVFIGKIVHAVQNDNMLFECGKDLIEVAEHKGLLNNVKIGELEVYQTPGNENGPAVTEPSY